MGFSDKQGQKHCRDCPEWTRIACKHIGRCSYIHDQIKGNAKVCDQYYIVTNTKKKS